jgi:hypothetical protein
MLIYLLLLVESNGKLISATAGSLSTGTASAFSGQQDVGHKGVATGRGVLSLYSFVAQSGCFGSCYSRRKLCSVAKGACRQLHSHRFRSNQLTCLFYETLSKNTLSTNQYLDNPQT